MKPVLATVVAATVLAGVVVAGAVFLHRSSASPCGQVRVLTGAEDYVVDPIAAHCFAAAAAECTAGTYEYDLGDAAQEVRLVPSPPSCTATVDVTLTETLASPEYGPAGVKHFTLSCAVVTDQAISSCTGAPPDVHGFSHIQIETESGGGLSI